MVIGPDTGPIQRHLAPAPVSRAKHYSHKAAFTERLHNRRKNELDKEFAERERELNDERSATGALLAIEQRRHGDAAAPSSPSLTMGLADFLVSEVRKKEMVSKDDLRLAAALAGYFPNGESGGRAIHTTLLNLVRASRLAEAVDGLYYAPESLDLEKLVNSEKADVFS